MPKGRHIPQYIIAINTIRKNTLSDMLEILQENFKAFHVKILLVRKEVSQNGSKIKYVKESWFECLDATINIFLFSACKSR